jgi:predicted DCC family thiol-disulfide oxidoreductase YuxK
MPVARGRRRIYLMYDQACPACDQYARLVRVRASVGELAFVDARRDARLLPEFRRKGLDIDEGMVLQIDPEPCYGTEAIRVLALLSSRSGGFNRLFPWSREDWGGGGKINLGTSCRLAPLLLPRAAFFGFP